MQKKQIIVLAIFSLLLTSSLSSGAETSIQCDSDFKYHLQGFTADSEAIYWSFTDVLYKTDWTGKKLLSLAVPSHHGDCCLHDGKLYVSVDREFAGAKTEKYFVYIYKCSDLSFIERIPMTTNGGIDGIEFVNGSFYIAEGKAIKDPRDYNIIYRYTPDLKTKTATFQVPGKTDFGVQAMTFSGDYFWLGTYGLGTIQAKKDLTVLQTKLPDGSVGIFPLPPSKDGEIRLMLARHIKKENGRCTATATPYVFRNGKLVKE